jgi:hypothetical protein
MSDPSLQQAFPSRPRGVARVIVELIVVGVCALGFGITMSLLLVSLVKSDTVGTRDFSVYWATGRQLVGHGNPYDAKALLHTELGLGFAADMGVKFMRNPPWVLPLTYVLGLMPIRIASVVWSLLLMAMLAISVRQIWVLHGRPKSQRTLLGYSFAPALLCLVIGQSSIFALLGISLFLTMVQKRPFWAGSSLWLCLMKPHLFLPFACVLLLWIVVTRSYSIVAGVGMMIAASAALTTWLDAAAWSQYGAMVRGSGIEVDYIPCLSFLLRNSISPSSWWIQYVPAGIGCAWAVAYYWPRRMRWDWAREGSMVLLVSVLVAPYCWLFDQVIAIPALLAGAYRARSRDLVLALAFASALIEGAFFANGKYPSAIYLWTLWTAPTWVIWYWLATRGREATRRREAIK